MHFGSGIPQIIWFPLEVYGWLTLKSIRWRIGSSHFYFQRNYLGGRKLEICGKATGWMLDCSSSIHNSLMINDKTRLLAFDIKPCEYDNAHNILNINTYLIARNGFEIQNDKTVQYIDTMIMLPHKA